MSICLLLPPNVNNQRPSMIPPPEGSSWSRKPWIPSLLTHVHSDLQLFLKFGLGMSSQHFHSLFPLLESAGKGLHFWPPHGNDCVCSSHTSPSTQTSTLHNWKTSDHSSRCGAQRSASGNRAAPSIHMLTSRSSFHQEGCVHGTGCSAAIPPFPASLTSRPGLVSYLQRWCAWYSRPPPPEFPAVVCGSLRSPPP